jgi:TM2 domain-containing membrane protein YozV
LRGQILDFSVKDNAGVILTEGGDRYQFTGADWKGDLLPSKTAWVDFVGAEGRASNIYQALPQHSGSSGKSKPALTLWALFLGSTGAHKFYMGAWGWGVVYLLTFWWLFVPVIIGLIETIRYILMSDQEFAAKLAVYKKTPFGFFW